MVAVVSLSRNARRGIEKETRAGHRGDDDDDDGRTVAALWRWCRTVAAVVSFAARGDARRRSGMRGNIRDARGGIEKETQTGHRASQRSRALAVVPASGCSGFFRSDGAMRDARSGMRGNIRDTRGAIEKETQTGHRASQQMVLRNAASGMRRAASAVRGDARRKIRDARQHQGYTRRRKPKPGPVPRSKR